MTRRGAPSLIHETTVAVLTRRWPGLQTTKFWRSMIAATDGDFKRNDDDPRSMPKIRPDAFMINQEEKTVTIFEVEDASKIDEHKMKKLVKIWFDMDCYEWEFEVYVCDRYGQNIGDYILDIRT